MKDSSIKFLASFSITCQKKGEGRERKGGAGRGQRRGRERKREEKKKKLKRKLQLVMVLRGSRMRRLGHLEPTGLCCVLMRAGIYSEKLAWAGAWLSWKSACLARMRTYVGTPGPT